MKYKTKYEALSQAPSPLERAGGEASMEGSI